MSIIIGDCGVTDNGGVSFLDGDNGVIATTRWLEGLKMIVSTVYESEFRDAFARSATYSKNFSYQALGLLYERLEALSEESGGNIELDIVAICCEFSEGTPAEIAANYAMGLNVDDSTTEEELLEMVLAELEERTSVVGTTDSGTIVYMNY